MELSHVTFLGFAIFSSLRVVSYLPQIMRVAADTNGASAISYATWGLWTAANIATGLYAAINLNDLYLSAISAIYAICCLVVIVLTTIKRRTSLLRYGEPRTAEDNRDALARQLATLHCPPHLRRG